MMFYCCVGLINIVPSGVGILINVYSQPDTYILCCRLIGCLAVYMDIVPSYIIVIKPDTYILCCRLVGWPGVREACTHSVVPVPVSHTVLEAVN